MQSEVVDLPLECPNGRMLVFKIFTIEFPTYVPIHACGFSLMREICNFNHLERISSTKIVKFRYLLN